MRICSLLPGATEVVAALGRSGELVGISHECDYPEAVRGLPVLVHAGVRSGESAGEIDRQVREKVADGQPLYRLDAARLTTARPDLIITQDLCHVCAVTPDALEEAIGALRPRPRVVSLNPQSLLDALADIERIGDAIGCTAEARELRQALLSRLERVRNSVAGVPPERWPAVACLEWLDPVYVGGHWVPEMVAWGGGRDVLGTTRRPSERLAWDAVVAAAPELLLAMPCGYSADRAAAELATLPKPPGWKDIPAVRAGRVYAVEAHAYFSRPGPRLVDGVELLAALFHPSLFGHGLPAGVRRVAS